MNEVVSAARGWTGTSFKHQGRLKQESGNKGGVDCLGLLIGVARELNLKGKTGELLHNLDLTDYSRIPDGEYLKCLLEKHLQVINIGDLAPNDIILMKFDGNPQHMGIVSDYSGLGLGLIHAYAPARKVVEHALDDWWRDKIVAAFRLSAAACAELNFQAKENAAFV